MRPEQQIHQAICKFIDLAAPDLFYFHPANETGRNSIRFGAIRKSMGVKSGIPDLVFILPRGRIAFIEIKSPKGTLTATQKSFRDLCLDKDWPWGLARSVNDVETILAGWLTPYGWKLKARAA